MRKIILHAAIVLIVTAAATFVERAGATTQVIQTAADRAPSGLQFAANICGGAGCAPVQTKRVIHHQKQGNTVPHHL
jgi:hypothetical protein